MLEVKLVEANGKSLHIETPYGEFKGTVGSEKMLVVVDPYRVHGTFASVSRSTAGTTNITAPPSNGALVLTDLILNAEKQNTGEVLVQFTDDSNTVPVFNVFVTDGPANIAIPFAGRFHGWRDARLDLVVTSDTDCTVTLGYLKVDAGLPFVEWDAFR